MKSLIKYLNFILIIGITYFSLIGCNKKNQEINNLKIIKLAQTSFVSEVQESDSNEIRIVATIEPNNATNKKLKWELSWSKTKNDDINKYISLQVSLDTLYCTVYYLKPFNTQIILTAISVANSSIKATCTLDCYQRYTIKTTSLHVDLNGGNETITSNGPIIDFRNYKTIIDDELEYCWFDETETSSTIEIVGTVSNNLEDENEYLNNLRYIIYLSDGLKNQLESYGITCKDDFGIEETKWNDTFLDMFNSLCETSSNDFYQALIDADHWFDLKVITGSGEIVKTYELLFDYVKLN